MNYKLKRGWRWLRGAISKESIKNLAELIKFVIRETVENKVWQAILIAIVSIVTQIVTEPSSAPLGRSDLPYTYMAATVRRAPGLDR